MITLSEVKRLSEKYGVNNSVVSLATLRKAIMVELEHKALIGHDHEKAMVIALAHLEEDPHYYKRLAKMEKQGEKYWTQHDKPNIFTIPHKI